MARKQLTDRQVRRARGALKGRRCAVADCIKPSEDGQVYCAAHGKDNGRG